MARKNRTPRMTCTGLSRNVKSRFRSLRAQTQPEPQPEPDHLNLDPFPDAMDLLAEQSDDEFKLDHLTIKQANDEFDKLTEEIYSQPEQEQQKKSYMKLRLQCDPLPIEIERPVRNRHYKKEILDDKIRFRNMDSDEEYSFFDDEDWEERNEIADAFQYQERIKK